MPDAWADNVLTMDEIQANPSSNVILGQLARSVARMHGLADATVRTRKQTSPRAFGAGLPGSSSAFLRQA